MNKKQSDQLKKLKKQQAALQQSMLDVAVNNDGCCTIQESSVYPAVKCPFLIGLGLFLFVIIIL